MVCIPCIFVPVLLFIWHRFLQPIMLKFWNPFGQVEQPKNDDKSKDEKEGSISTDKNESESKSVSEKMTCPFANSKETSNSSDSKVIDASDKKND